MIMTNEERLDMVALFNAQDAEAKLRKEVITVNGVKITCYETGEIARSNRSSGKTIRGFGGKGCYGYLEVRIGGKLMKSHRLIATAFLGEIPESMHVDHIDGDKMNNALINLRIVTERQNQRAFKLKRNGASSKYRGVSWDSKKGKWQVNVLGKYIGRFNDETDAAAAYDSFAIESGLDESALNSTNFNI